MSSVPALSPIRRRRRGCWFWDGPSRSGTKKDDAGLIELARHRGIGIDAWIAEQQTGHRGPSLAICTVGDERPLGKIALRMPGRASPATLCAAICAGDYPVGELSYWVLPDARGRGLASAAVVAMLDRARRDAALRSVVLDI